jgi:glycerate kinase
MRVLLAFDKFKDSLTATQACELTLRTLREQHPDWTFDSAPLADGGEGFAEILTAAAGGRLEQTYVAGPRGKPVTAHFGLVPAAQIPPAARALLKLGPAREGPLALVEMAVASGLALQPIDQRDPWQATTLGTGELMRQAAELGAQAVLLGVGGSATSDLGLGALQALGLQFQTSSGADVRPAIPARWNEIARIQGEVARTFPAIRIACDVTNPLLGPKGAAAIYGPQKGLLPTDVSRLDHASARMALMLSDHCRQPDTLMDLPGAGAAGGLPFGLMAAARAQLLPGFDLVAAWLDLENRLAAADVVITGEGRFDDSSLSGKGPGAVVSHALALGKTVHVFAGAVTSTGAGVGGRLPQLHAITPVGTPLPEALRNAAKNLGTAVASAFPR